MNYYWLARKYQDGGAMPELNGDPMEQIVALVQAAMSGDQQAASQIEQIMLAAQQGDPQAQQLAQAIQEVAQQLLGGQPEAAKQGTKIKKACKGKWLQNGGTPSKDGASKEDMIPVKNIAKGGKPCGCGKARLHKIGGRIIEICE